MCAGLSAGDPESAFRLWRAGQIVRTFGLLRCRPCCTANELWYALRVFFNSECSLSLERSLSSSASLGGTVSGDSASVRQRGVECERPGCLPTPLAGEARVSLVSLFPLRNGLCADCAETEFVVVTVLTTVADDAEPGRRLRRLPPCSDAAEDDAPTPTTNGANAASPSGGEPKTAGCVAREAPVATHQFATGYVSSSSRANTFGKKKGSLHAFGSLELNSVPGVDEQADCDMVPH